MNAADNNLVQLITGKPSLQETTVNELDQIANLYPYFSLAQLLLAEKLKQEKADNFIGQLQHCAIYFHDVAWMQSRLYSKEQTPAAIFVDADKRVDSGFGLNNEKSTAGNIEIAAGNPEENLVESANIIILPAAEVLEDFTLQMNDVKDEPELPPLDEEELVNQGEETPEALAKIADVLQQQVVEFNAPVEEEANVSITTEPYHTIDYFASQGIKVDTQALDALTKKVHTFTDWLKQMKRISPHPTDLGSDVEMESFVQSIADTSNQLKAVDTEAMAEVLVKQGKIDKAIEVYQKLSLLNPGKTAYFAAKINQLKRE